MLRFQNDYSEGAHPNVLRALCDTNLSSTPGYGLDDDCRRAADAIRARFACPDADVHFLVGGTQTNQLAAAAFLYLQCRRRGKEALIFRKGAKKS